jgi:hypothetical protein
VSKIWRIFFCGLLRFSWKIDIFPRSQSDGSVVRAGKI